MRRCAREGCSGFIGSSSKTICVQAMKSNIIRSSQLATLTALATLAALPAGAQSPQQLPLGTPVGLPVYVPLQNSLPVRPEVAARLRPVNAGNLWSQGSNTNAPAAAPAVTKISRAVYLEPSGVAPELSDAESNRTVRPNTSQQMSLKPPSNQANIVSEGTGNGFADHQNTVKPVVGLSTPWAATDRQVALVSDTPVTSNIPTVQRTVYFQDPISVPDPGTFAPAPGSLPSNSNLPAAGGSMALPPGLSGGASAPAVGLPPGGGSSIPGTTLPPASMIDNLPSGGGAAGSLGGASTTLPAPLPSQPLPSQTFPTQPLPSQTFPSQPLPSQTYPSPPTTDYSQIEQPAISPHANMDNCRLIIGATPHPSTHTFYGVCQPVVPSNCTTPVAPPPQGFNSPVQVLPPRTPLVTQPGQVQAPARALVSFGQERNVVQVGQGLWGQPVAYVPKQGIRNWFRYIFP